MQPICAVRLWTISAYGRSRRLCGLRRHKLPAAAERLPGKWHGEMIVYDETQAKLPPDRIAEMAQDAIGLRIPHRRFDGAFRSELRARPTPRKAAGKRCKQEGDLLTIKSTEQTRQAKGHQDRV